MNAAGQLPYGYAYYQAVPQAPGLYPAFTAPNVFVSILHLYSFIHPDLFIHSFIHSSMRSFIRKIQNNNSGHILSLIHI